MNDQVATSLCVRRFITTTVQRHRAWLLNTVAGTQHECGLYISALQQHGEEMAIGTTVRTPWGLL